ncbi:hydantoinase/oxoprolinase N-terminal domain-containing protein [Afifella pfennigii]|uniref:hydantoinase/oxoprolinase N-terminal domain-containing protein n=1 Tax=Afifella pfennigii TaxID=209897 RepID=UPI0005578125|nr:hydantoinase/oxoprolinase family protein [Afifella pfennigii]
MTRYGQLRIGIDVGGTNTDAALLDGASILASCKTPTTEDVTAGIRIALRQVMNAAAVERTAVGAVMIGTTHFTNAVVERRGLARVAAIRLGLPAATALPPLTDWPDDLAAAVDGGCYMFGGGHEYDGRPIEKIDLAALERIACTLAADSRHDIEVTAIFSPLYATGENQTAELLKSVDSRFRVTRSHELGRLGILERENAAILNAALRPLAARTTAAFRRALAEEHIDAPLYISQNDGTVAHVDVVERFPVSTFSAGPTNSMRGAAILTGVDDAIVIDIGGTTSDVGMLLGGFPREAPVATQLGGVRTNLRMPDIVSVGLGGGSIVRDGGESIGPDSVGFRLRERALVFGGDTLTATDIAVAAGRSQIGDPARVKDLDSNVVTRALHRMSEILDDAVDRVRTSRGSSTVILVGGGAVLIDADQLSGADIRCPDHAGVANAVGAASAQVAGECDHIYAYTRTPRAEALRQAQALAIARAVDAGAEPGSVEIVDSDETPLSYLPNEAMRVRVKAVGRLIIAAGDGELK